MEQLVYSPCYFLCASWLALSVVVPNDCYLLHLKKGLLSVSGRLTSDLLLFDFITLPFLHTLVLKNIIRIKQQRSLQIFV